MNKAVFIDRDGVICEDTNYITSIEKLKIFDFSKKSIDILHKNGFKVIVVTNQSAVARGMITEEKLKYINDYVKNEINVDDIYYCPHLPPEHEETLPYRINCQCRKPKSGLIKLAAKDFNVDLNKSYMVGDRKSDISAGKNAGLKTIYVKSGVNENIKIEADLFFDNILEFADYLDEELNK